MLYKVIKHDPTSLYANLTATYEYTPSNIFLMPAPGEEFTLDIASLDQLLGNVSTSAYLHVSEKFVPTVQKKLCSVAACTGAHA